MKLHHLREVVAIAEKGSIRGASRALNVAQPAMTRSVAELERELGAPLFERRARGAVATPIGQAFIQRATTILQEIRCAQEEVDQLRGLSTGTVTAGLSIAAHLSLLSAALKPFRAKYRQVTLRLIEGYYSTLETGLRNGSVDFCVGPDPGGGIAPGLEKEILSGNRRTVISRVGHPLAAATSLHQLVDADWASMPTSGDSDREMIATFRQHGLPPPRIVVRSQSALTLMTCLTSSDLLAIAPLQWVKSRLTRDLLTAVATKEDLVAPAVVAIKRADIPLTPAATWLLDLMRRAAVARRA
jgi:LysR family transcriptional regulator, regulator of abg operon